ncbi:MAG: tetratricopeptide repeat protein [Proteobacteria bacterium]|nr:tetratricopeptide repeat protein [Pseudomonadota bacterium]MDA0846079.1 tetratricopeptide repeat protein [Pseudomonadota bacterium]
MADIFDEIDEDLKRDQMQLLWARYGKIVMAAVAAIVLLVALRQGYAAWQTSQAEASASAYQQALKSDDVVTALEAQRGQLTNGYAMLAQFQIAAEQAARDDFAAAEASYLALASDASLDPMYQQVATLLSVMVAPQDTDVSALESRLSDLETAAGPWQAMALETGAGLALRNGNKDAAVAKYKTLAEMADVPAGMRQRAERMIVMLGE